MRIEKREWIRYARSLPWAQNTGVLSVVLLAKEKMRQSIGGRGRRSYNGVARRELPKLLFAKVILNCAFFFCGNKVSGGLYSLRHVNLLAK